MKQAIFSFGCDFGRSGELEGKFVSTQEKVDRLIESGLEVYFGEVLGKHSEVYGAIEEGDIELVSDDPTVVKVFIDNKLASGFDPFEYTFLSAPAGWEDKTVDEYIDHLLNETPN